MTNSNRAHDAMVAKARMRAIRRELTELYRAFPDLAPPDDIGAQQRTVAHSDDSGAPVKGHRPTRPGREMARAVAAGERSRVA